MALSLQEQTAVELSRFNMDEAIRRFEYLDNKGDALLRIGALLTALLGLLAAAGKNPTLVLLAMFAFVGLLALVVFLRWPRDVALTPMENNWEAAWKWITRSDEEIARQLIVQYQLVAGAQRGACKFKARVLVFAHIALGLEVFFIVIAALT